MDVAPDRRGVPGTLMAMTALGICSGLMEGMSFSETAAYFKERFSLPMTLEEIKQCWSRDGHGQIPDRGPLKARGQGVPNVTVRTRGSPQASPPAMDRPWWTQSLEALADRRVFPGGGHRLRGGKAGKPAPDIYLEVARRLQVDSGGLSCF